MDLQKITSTGTAVAVIGGGTFMGGNYAIDQATGGPEKRIKAVSYTHLTLPPIYSV